MYKRLFLLLALVAAFATTPEATSLRSLVEQDPDDMPEEMKEELIKEKEIEEEMEKEEEKEMQNQAKKLVLLKCKYYCPKDSIRVSMLKCPKDIGDCKCRLGFIKKGGECIKLAIKPPLLPIPIKCAYRCPENSIRVTLLKCPKDFDDCKCKLGYKKFKDGCKKFTILPLPKPKPLPVPLPIKCKYQCPKGSLRKSLFKCPLSYKDCRCKYGYYMQTGGYCTKAEMDCKYKCPPNSFQITKSRCPLTHFHCKCVDGYFKNIFGKCVNKKPFPILVKKNS